MTWILVGKLLRDIRVGWCVVAVLLFAFQILWAHITQRISGEILVAFDRLGVPIDTLRNIIFQGPGAIVQAIMGGADIRIERAMDLLSIGYVHPLVITMLSVWAAGRSGQALAGELERGSMELLLAQPIRRGQVIAAHVLVDVVTLPPLAAIVWLGTYTGVWLIGGLEASRPFLQIDPLRFAPALLCVLGLLVAASGPALWLSALGRSRMRVLGLAVTLLLIQFLVNVLSQLWPPLQPLRYCTLFYYYQPQEMILQADWYTHVAVWARLAVLFGVGAAGYGLAWLAFCRRDLPAPL